MEDELRVYGGYVSCLKISWFLELLVESSYHFQLQHATRFTQPSPSPFFVSASRWEDRVWVKVLSLPWNETIFITSTGLIVSSQKSPSESRLLCEVCWWNITFHDDPSCGFHYNLINGHYAFCWGLDLVASVATAWSCVSWADSVMSDSMRGSCVMCHSNSTCHGTSYSNRDSLRIE